MFLALLVVFFTVYQNPYKSTIFLVFYEEISTICSMLKNVDFIDFFVD
tara:strand:+ start:317 stop:460 length:144 start_codon:yes stop_codon:yes gene_type:complete